MVKHKAGKPKFTVPAASDARAASLEPQRTPFPILNLEHPHLPSAEDVPQDCLCDLACGTCPMCRAYERSRCQPRC